MRTLKNKHLVYEDRCVIQEFLNYGFTFTQIANRLGKHRTTVAKEVLLHGVLKNTSNDECSLLNKAPYVCNGYEKKYYCKKKKHVYDCNFAQNEYQKSLKESRSIFHNPKSYLTIINANLIRFLI